jgi:hypothetical protein
MLKLVTIIINDITKSVGYVAMLKLVTIFLFFV